MSLRGAYIADILARGAGPSLKGAYSVKRDRCCAEPWPCQCTSPFALRTRPSRQCDTRFSFGALHKARAGQTGRLSKKKTQRNQKNTLLVACSFVCTGYLVSGYGAECADLSNDPPAIINAQPTANRDRKKNSGSLRKKKKTPPKKEETPHAYDDKSVPRRG